MSGKSAQGNFSKNEKRALHAGQSEDSGRVVIMYNLITVVEYRYNKTQDPDILYNIFLLRYILWLIIDEIVL